MCFLKCERDPLYLHVRTHSFPTRGSSDLFDLGSWAYEGMLGIPVEAIAILAIVLLNAGLGSFQEYRSEQALAQLKAMAAPQAWVLRDGRLQHIPSTEIVPGDLLRVTAGERIPAEDRKSTRLNSSH